MKIALFGATGQIGSVLFKQLCDNFPDTEMLACVRNKHHLFKNVNGNTKHHAISFDPFNSDWAVLKDLDVLINCVGIIKETPGLNFADVHIGLTKKIMASRALIGYPKIIQLSVLGADENSASPYQSTKGNADAILLQAERTYVIRPSIVCSHNTLFVQKFKLLKRVSRFMFGAMFFPAGFLKTKIQPVLVEDLCNVICNLCSSDPTEKIINVTGPEEITIYELIKKIDNSRVVPISQKLFNGVYKLFYPILKNVLPKAQYDLLLKDNIADPSLAERIAGQKMQSAEAFWKLELN
jgi:uncharacterized protein YbjT (DUF2867 family)